MNRRNLRARGLHFGKCLAIQSTSSTACMHVLNVKRTKKILLGRVCCQSPAE